MHIVLVGCNWKIISWRVKPYPTLGYPSHGYPLLPFCTLHNYCTNKHSLESYIYRHNLNLKPNLAQGPWQNAQMVHIQYICHLNFKKDRFLANNAWNLCTKASNAHYMLQCVAFGNIDCGVSSYYTQKQVTIVNLPRL